MAGIDELLRLHPPTHPVLVEVMVRDYRVAVFRLALSLLADPDDAEDATQETFIKAARYLARYRAVPTSGPGFLKSQSIPAAHCCANVPRVPTSSGC